jgi:hypothetical protein
MVRPNGPVLVQRSFHSDQYNTSTRSSCPVGLRRATSGSFGTRVLVLVAGAVLAPGKRTMTQVLRVMGLGRARWDARAVARRLLLHLLDRLLPSGPVVIGIDDTIEWRWGTKIKARGIYRDPVRSSKEHFVKTSGLRWLSLMVVVPISWSGRHWALPFLTVLAPSVRWSKTHRKRHKTLTDWARQAILNAGCPTVRSSSSPTAASRQSNCWSRFAATSA